MTWIVRLSRTARADLRSILQWTRENFGEVQRARYEAALKAALVELQQQGTDVPGIQRRDDVRPGLMMLHVARKGRRGRHWVCLRAYPGMRPEIEILRILHDAMDLPRHLPPG